MITMGNAETTFDSPEQLLTSVAMGLSITGAEIAALEPLLAEFDSWIVGTNPEIAQVRLIGSVTRGTRLPKSIDPSADVDFLLGIETSLEDVQTSPETYWTKFNAVRSRLLQDPGLICDKKDPHPYTFFKLSRGSEQYELVLAHTEKSGRSYTLMRVGTAWELNHSGDDSPGFQSGGDDESASHTGSFFIDPWRFNGYMEEFTRVYGDWWRYLILLWKYWNVLAGKPERSYVIERNVFEGLGNASIVGGRENFLSFCASFFGDRRRYDYERFNKYPSFQAFRDAIIRAHEDSLAGQTEAAIKDLQSVLPYSDIAERLTYIPPEPAGPESDPDGWLAVHRLLWLKPPKSAEEYRKNYRKLRFWKKVDPLDRISVGTLADEWRTRVLRFEPVPHLVGTFLELRDSLTSVYENAYGDEKEDPYEFDLVQCKCGHTLIAGATTMDCTDHCIECGAEIENNETNTVYTFVCDCGHTVIAGGSADKTCRCPGCGVERKIIYG